MLGRLARWLRLSGYDVTYRGGMDRAAFTRATEFDELADIPPYRLLAGDDLDDQLRQVYDAFPEMDPYSDFLSRCVDCNVPLEEIAKGDFKDSIPPKAMQLEGRFCRCPSCGKLLWPGSHVERIKSRLEKLSK